LRARSLTAAVFEFLVGDDWRTAIGVVALLAATALLAAAGLPAWPLTLIATVAVLLESVRRAYAHHRGAERL
jgi:membrane protein implicated in regulation of membrane protease activity